jgi:hypothetical protein
MTTAGTNNVVAAADATKKGSLDLSGTGTVSHCGTSLGVHTPNLKTSFGSFTFTPSFPGVEFHPAAVGNVDFKGGAVFNAGSVC